MFLDNAVSSREAHREREEIDITVDCVREYNDRFSRVLDGVTDPPVYPLRPDGGSGRLQKCVSSLPVTSREHVCLTPCPVVNECVINRVILKMYQLCVCACYCIVAIREHYYRV